jgi:hypothetical protein
MKKWIAVPVLVAGTIGVSGVAFAVVGTPEVNNANANVTLNPVASFKPTACAGEDGIHYITYRGTWKGAEHDVTPGNTDYDLSGSLKVANVLWTINTQTQRGVLKGAVTLAGLSATGAPTGTIYSGNLVLITQGMPASAGTVVPGRGWISAATSTAGTNDGGSILANVEFKITPSFDAVAVFGDSAANGNTPNFSVAFNNQTC